jgi:hypothetical protein
MRVLEDFDHLIERAGLISSCALSTFDILKNITF